MTTRGCSWKPLATGRLSQSGGFRTERHTRQRRRRRWGIPWRVELRVLSKAECAAEGMSSAGSFLQRRRAVLQRRRAVLALMAAAATLLPGLAVAQDVYLRAGIDLSRPTDTHFTDADCASLVPAALYGCGPSGGRRAAPVGGERRARSQASSLGSGTPWRPPYGWKPF